VSKRYHAQSSFPVCFAALDPLHPYPQRHDLAEVWEERDVIVLCEPTSASKNKPSGREMREVLYQLVEELPFPRRVRDDEVRIVEVGDVELDRVLDGHIEQPVGGELEVIGRKAVVPCVLQMMNESAVARTRLTERSLRWQVL
jgi:hypothetical protein